MKSFFYNVLKGQNDRFRNFGSLFSFISKRFYLSYTEIWGGGGSLRNNQPYLFDLWMFWRWSYFSNLLRENELYDLYFPCCNQQQFSDNHKHMQNHFNERDLELASPRISPTNKKTWKLFRYSQEDQLSKKFPFMFENQSASSIAFANASILHFYKNLLFH